MMRLGFSDLSGRNGIQELQSLDAFLNRVRDSCPKMLQGCSVLTGRGSVVIITGSLGLK